VKSFPEIVVHFLSGLQFAVDQEVGSAEETDCDTVFEFIEDLLCLEDMLSFKLEQLLCDGETLIVYLMVVMFEISTELHEYLDDPQKYLNFKFYTYLKAKLPASNLRSSLFGIFLHLPGAVMLDHLTLFLVDTPVLCSVFRAAVLGLLAVGTQVDCLSFAHLATLESTIHNGIINKTTLNFKSEAD
jgi:hypothetical protein